MKMNLTREWFFQRAALDDKAEVSAGSLISTACPPPDLKSVRTIHASSRKP